MGSKLKREEAAWLAGLFDGEGCVAYRTDPTGNLMLRLRIGMTHFDTIARYSDLMDQAGVKTNYYEQSLPSGKIIFTCEIARRDAALVATDLLLRHSITKAGDLAAARFALRSVLEDGDHAVALHHLAEAIPPRYRKR